MYHVLFIQESVYASELAAHLYERFADGDGHRSLPSDVINGDPGIQRAFIAGVFRAPHENKYTERSWIAALGLYCIMNATGVSCYTRSDSFGACSFYVGGHNEHVHDTKDTDTRQTITIWDDADAPPAVLRFSVQSGQHAEMYGIRTASTQISVGANEWVFRK